ncbi:MAG: putative surface protein with fasciclin (FAS1) repeats [Candidatus Azotimanducaceae bacterium]|jgi:uncharacterized surface protein with fasciclin (FAS1) repeats
MKTLRILLLLITASFALIANAGGHAASGGAMKGHHAHGQDIVDVAIANGSFTTLVTAVQAAGLVDTLKSEGPFTVFAPTDAAFAKLPAATLAALLKDKDALAGILTYHVVAGKVMATDVVTLTEATTVQGQNVQIKVENGKVFIDNAEVVITDVLASNGVIHVIDTVILPKS